MIKKTFVGLLANEQLMKNVFAGIGYLAFSAGVARLVLSNLGSEALLVRLAVASFLLLLFSLSLLFWLLHVVRPLVKITWPKFGIPGIDKEAETIPFSQVFKRVDIMVYGIAAVLSLQVGLYLVEALLHAQ